LCVQLLVSGGRGVDHEGLGVTDIGKVRCELDRVDEFLAGVDAAFDAEREHTAVPVGEDLLGHLVVRMILETRIVDPRHLGLLLQPQGELEGVVNVALDSQ